MPQSMCDKYYGDLIKHLQHSLSSFKLKIKYLKTSFFWNRGTKHLREGGGMKVPASQVPWSRIQRWMLQVQDPQGFQHYRVRFINILQDKQMRYAIIKVIHLFFTQKSLKETLQNFNKYFQSQLFIISYFRASYLTVYRRYSFCRTFHPHKKYIFF